MRVGHLLLAVFLSAIVMSLARTPEGRVMVVTFVFGVAMVAAAITTLLAMFQTVGSLGTARGGAQVVEALVATAAVTVVGAGVTVMALWAGIWLVLRITA